MLILAAVAVALLAGGEIWIKRAETPEHQWKMDVDGLILAGREREKEQSKRPGRRGKYSACPWKGANQWRNMLRKSRKFC